MKVYLLGRHEGEKLTKFLNFEWGNRRTRSEIDPFLSLELIPLRVKEFLLKRVVFIMHCLFKRVKAFALVLF